MAEEQRQIETRSRIEGVRRDLAAVTSAQVEDRKLLLGSVTRTLADVNAKIDCVKQSTSRLDSLIGPAILTKAADTVALVAIIIYLLLR